MSITMGNTTSAARANVSRPRRLHHAAWITRDQEATRHFYEDLIGLPLEATWAERGPTGREYCHTFFTLGDGGALAFFQYADQDENPVELSSPGHVHGHGNLHVRGYKEEGTTTTPFDMTVLNDLDRFHLIEAVIDHVPALGAQAAHLRQRVRDKLVEHREYITRHGEDMPEIRNWKWH
jgi:catechol 2,3-dioxygenase-like lactoylglutathione lyase family enzyme